MDAGAEYRIVLEVPGAQKDRIEVLAGPAPGTIFVRAEGKEDAHGQSVVRGERGLRGGIVRFERVLPIAPDADVSAVKTELREGVLTVIVPKRKSEAASSKK